MSQAPNKNVYVPGDRLRLRHLLSSIEAHTECDNSQAEQLISVIENLVQELIDHGRAIELPRIGIVDRHSFPTSPATTVPHVPTVGRPVHWSDLAGVAAERTGLPPTITQAGLSVMWQMIEDANPDAAVFVPGWGYDGPEAALDEAMQDDYGDEIEHLRRAGTNIWLLQCNPAKYDVIAQIAETGELPTDWSINRYRDVVQVGDRVVFWISGPTGGVAAVGEVSGDVFQGAVATPFEGDEAHAQWTTFVPIDLTIDLFDSPIPRQELKRDKRMQDQSIFKVPAAANPHRLSAAAFEAIVERLPERAPGA